MNGLVWLLDHLFEVTQIGELVLLHQNQDNGDCKFFEMMCGQSKTISELMVEHAFTSVKYDDISVSVYGV
jgi:hypothetical protein